MVYEDQGGEDLDPLSILRKFTRNKSNMIRVKQIFDEGAGRGDYFVPLMEGEMLRIGPHLLDAYGPVALKSKAGNTKPYCLLAVWLMMLHEKSYGKYVADCGKHRVASIAHVIQSAFAPYMRGEEETCKYLDQALLEQQTADRKARRDKRQDGQVAGLTEESNVAAAPKETKDWDINDIIRAERTTVDRNTLLEITGNKDLLAVLEIYRRADQEEAERLINERKRQQPDQRNGNGHGGHGVPSKMHHTPGNHKRPRSGRDRPSPSKSNGVVSAEKLRIPIIVVPEALTSMVNMYNVKDFLENGEFLPVDEAKAKNPKKPSVITIERKSNIDPSKNAKWEIMDDVSKLTPDEWRRVVGVIVTGVNWQFKKWPYSTTAEWFQHATGFYFHYDDERPKPVIATWTVSSKPLSKIKRYLDQGVSREVWNELDEFVSIHNKHRKLFH